MLRVCSGVVVLVPRLVREHCRLQFLRGAPACACAAGARVGPVTSAVALCSLTTFFSEFRPFLAVPHDEDSLVFQSFL